MNMKKKAGQFFAAEVGYFADRMIRIVFTPFYYFRMADLKKFCKPSVSKIPLIFSSGTFMLNETGSIIILLSKVFCYV